MKILIYCNLNFFYFFLFTSLMCAYHFQTQLLCDNVLLKSTKFYFVNYINRYVELLWKSQRGSFYVLHYCNRYFDQYVKCRDNNLTTKLFSLYMLVDIYPVKSTPKFLTKNYFYYVNSLEFLLFFLLFKSLTFFFFV